MKINDSLYYYPEAGMLDCNKYVIRGGTSVIIDTGLPEMLPDLIEQMAKDSIKPEEISAIFNTHLHLDHCWANQSVKELTRARIMLHPLQREHFDVSFRETSEFFGIHPVAFKEDACLKEDSLREIGLDWDIIPSPGHSPDSVCYYSRHDKCLICGDVVFSASIGRSDLPGGDEATLAKSIENLSGLEIDYLLPGHMGIVRGVKQVQANFRMARSFFGL